MSNGPLFHFSFGAVRLIENLHFTKGFSPWFPLLSVTLDIWNDLKLNFNPIGIAFLVGAFPKNSLTARLSFPKPDSYSGSFSFQFTLNGPLFCSFVQTFSKFGYNVFKVLLQRFQSSDVTFS